MTAEHDAAEFREALDKALIPLVGQHAEELRTHILPLIEQRVADAAKQAKVESAEDLRVWRQTNATNYRTSVDLLALERKWRGAADSVEATP